MNAAQSAPAGAAAGELRALRDEIRRLRAALPPPPSAPEPPSEDWSGRLARHAALTYEERPLADIQRLVIHQSGLPAEIGPEQVARYQVERRGWPGIGYHFFIRADGTILTTAPLEAVTYHTRRFDQHAAGLCLAGRFDAAPPPEAQLEATAALAAYLCGRLRIHAALGGIVGHNELVQTECPGAQWQAGARWRERLLERVARLQESERRRQNRAIGHYLLFWQDAEQWDGDAWDAARGYVARFRPVCGFSLETAATAAYVTLVGDAGRFPPAVEELLQGAGCTVERIAAPEGSTLRQVFDGMAENGRRFLTISL